MFSKIHQIVQHSILFNEDFKLLGKSHGDQKSGKDNQSQAYLKKKSKIILFLLYITNFILYFDLVVGIITTKTIFFIFFLSIVKMYFFKVYKQIMMLF